MGGQEWGRPPMPEPTAASRRSAAGRAVVVGAGIAGLLAARALAPQVAEVTVIDKDRLPPTATPRKGAPQGRHAHILAAGGADALAALFADDPLDLDAAGAPAVSWWSATRSAPSTRSTAKA
jgi:2-polyprenyl-6-methoxyphenol hydroxylase-like FAD-dependent oxidoreductase